LKEEPLQIIEEYLMLVRSHMSPSTAEDVIDELRDYIVDAAAELGEGAVTVKSAKRAVARMGAPSEVAREYAASLVAEEKLREAGGAAADGPESFREGEALTEVGGGMTLLPVETGEATPVEPTTYVLASVRVLLVLGVLSLVVSMTIVGAVFVLWELLGATAILSLRLAQLYWRRDSLLQASYHNRVKRLLSVPRKLDPFVSRRMIVLDFCLTLGFATVLSGGFLLGGLERFSAGVACSLLFGRIAVQLLRVERPALRPQAIMRIQLSLQIATAMILNVTAELSIFYYYWYAFGYSLTPFLSIAVVILATYMITVSTMQVDFLWGGLASREFLTKKREPSHHEGATALGPSPRIVSKRATEPAEITIARPALRPSSVLFSWLFWMFYSLALLPIGLAVIVGMAVWTPERTMLVWEILSYTCVSVLLVIWLIVVYLGVRWAFARRRRSSAAVGVRSRPEAIVDSIATTFLIALALSTLFSWPFQYHLWNLAQSPATLLRTGLLLVVSLLLVTGLVVRLCSDIRTAVTGDSSFRSFMLRASCILILTAIGGFMSDGVLSDPYSLPPSYFTVSLYSAFPAAFLGLQAVTSKAKFLRVSSSKRSASKALTVPSDDRQGVDSCIATLRVLKRKTLLLALLWPLVSFVVTLFVVDAVVLGYYPTWHTAILVSFIYTVFVAALSMIYFGARRAMIYAGEADTVIGGRRRGEAALDLVGIVCFLAALGWGYYSMRLYDSLYSSPFAIDTGLALSFEMIFWAAFVVGILMRAAADVAFIASRRRVIPRTVFLISGVLLLGGIAFIIPLHMAILDLGWTAFWLAIAALLNLQVVTSLAALDELSLQQTPTLRRETQNDGYPAGMVIPTN